MNWVSGGIIVTNVTVTNVKDKSVSVRRFLHDVLRFKNLAMA